MWGAEVFVVRRLLDVHFDLRSFNEYDNTRSPERLPETNEGTGKPHHHGSQAHLLTTLDMILMTTANHGVPSHRLGVQGSDTACYYFFKLLYF